MNHGVQCKGVVIDTYLYLYLLYNTLEEGKISIFLCKLKTFVAQLDYTSFQKSRI